MIIDQDTPTVRGRGRRGRGSRQEQSSVPASQVPGGEAQETAPSADSGAEAVKDESTQPEVGVPEETAESAGIAAEPREDGSAGPVVAEETAASADAGAEHAEHEGEYGDGAMSAGAAPPAHQQPGSGTAYGAPSHDRHAYPTEGSGGGNRSGWNGGRSGYGNRDGQERTTPSDYQVRQIAERGVPIPPTYAGAQALLDSFEPTAAQQRRLDEHGLKADSRGEAKDVLAKLVEENPHLSAEWVAHGVESVPTDAAEAAKMIDDLPASEAQINLLRSNGRAVPNTRAEASEIINNLPATPGQTRAITLATNGRYWPRTRGDAQRWFRENPRTPDPEKELGMAA
jgi:hypothetical protein